MNNAKPELILVGLMVVSGLLAGCAWDNSPPPYHSVISYDPSRAKTYVSAVPSNNAPSMHDWKTNQVSGVGYGSTGPNTPATPGQPAGGAASTPSGVSYGGAAGTTTTGPSTSPGSGTPGTIIGNPPAPGTIGTYPTPAPTATAGPLTSPAISPPQPPTALTTSPGTAPNSTTPFSSPSSQSPGFSTGITNTGSGALFTNRFTAPTNSLSPGLNVPRP